MDNRGEIIIYQTEDGLTKIDVNMQDETVWLTQEQLAELFQRDKSTISRHIKNIFDEGELDEKVVVAEFATTTRHGAIEGKTQTSVTKFYNLDVIISVGYRVKSQQGVQFRIWATNILKEYIKKGLFVKWCGFTKKSHCFIIKFNQHASKTLIFKFSKLLNPNETRLSTLILLFKPSRGPFE